MEANKVSLKSYSLYDVDNKLIQRSRYEEYPKIIEEQVNEEEAEKITGKIARHFKLGRFTLSFYGNRGARIWSEGYGGAITFPHKVTVALICHELCHALTRKKYGKKIRHSSKKWMTQLNRLVRYCVRKNCWKDKIEKWRTPKPQKPEPTKEEIQKQKIRRVEEKIDRYGRKLRIYQKKLSRAKRSLAMLRKKRLD